MFTYKLSNSRVIVSVFPLTVVEHADWNIFVVAEATADAAKAALEAAWEVERANLPVLDENKYYKSPTHRAYQAYQARVKALPSHVFVGEEPLPQGPVQGFVPMEDIRIHAAYGGWDQREYWTHSSVRPARVQDTKVYTEKEAWRFSAKKNFNGDYPFEGDACGTHVAYRDL